MYRVSKFSFIKRSRKRNAKLNYVDLFYFEFFINCLSPLSIHFYLFFMQFFCKCHFFTVNKRYFAIIFDYFHSKESDFFYLRLFSIVKNILHRA